MRSYRRAIPPAPSAVPDEVTVHPTPLQSDEADANDEDIETEEEEEKDTYIDEIYQIMYVLHLSVTNVPISEA
ncbi:hypothetical protein HDU77_000121 [Chytriomyces hyalinus]|nr:hypothetical protein HDU77_000121 [Chytriomyces hyalinus]